MTQDIRIFRKTKPVKKNGKKTETAYYWASVSDKDNEGNWISANIFARLSKQAQAKFEKICEETKNETVDTAYVTVIDAWLKAVPGKDHPNMVLFINVIAPAECPDPEDD